MAKHEYVSEVTVKISVDDDGKFKGHIFADGDHMITIPNKSRDTAIGHALGQAKAALKKDNVEKKSGLSPESRQKP